MFAWSTRRVLHALLLATSLGLGLVSCGGGGGGGGDTGPEVKGVFTGFSGDLDWVAPGGGGDGPGGGADGDGGAGAGGALGQFRRALVVVTFPDGTELGRALTDDVRGMVTIKAGRSYNGPLLIELRGQPDALYFEEGLEAYVPFPPGKVLRAIIPRISKNIGVTPFTEAGYQLALSCQGGISDCTSPKSVYPANPHPIAPSKPATAAASSGAATTAPAAGTSVSTKALPSTLEIEGANARVLELLNRQFPSLLQVDDIARLPYIVNDGSARGDITLSQRGRYGLVNIAFSKQAAMFNTRSGAPTLLAINQLSADVLDGRLDGQSFGAPAGPAGERTYDPGTLTTELSSALAQQTGRYGGTEAVAALPPVVAFGNVRYDSYYFDAKVVANGTASTIAIATETATPAGQPPKRQPGQPTEYVTPEGDKRAFMVYGNMGNGALFIKTDSSNSTSRILAIGDNTNGELASGNQVAPRSTPYEIALPGVLTHVAGGMGHTVARFADGSVWAWGDNAYGQLGQGFITGLARSLQPVRVTLPKPAIAVAAANVSSFALLEDGTVYSWGSAWGFGTLGDGTKSGQRLTPGPVLTSAGALTGVVQLVGRDNDVVALTGDGTVFSWGSYPAPSQADGEVPPTGSAGGQAVATPMVGLPTDVRVRKVLTEQALFAALMEDGAVYTWGVHFDITANAVLHDYRPVRVLNLPPVRDMMPGGFLGYGPRPFDRMTGMAIDYDNQLFRIRGRVAERYDPARPTNQRRPKGQAPRPDCASCHTVLGRTLPPAPPKAGAAACGLIPPNILPLLTSESVCESCHNGAPLSTGTALPLLACVPPSLPAPGPASQPAGFDTVCQLPPTNHTTISPGAFCASCHNSVISAPLKCVATPATTAPALTTTTTLDTAASGGTPIARGSVTAASTASFTGTLGAPLNAGESLEVLANGSRLGVATVSGAAWSFTATGLTSGSYAVTTRVASAAGLGPQSAAYEFTVENTVPAQTATVASVADDVGLITGTLSSGQAGDDPTPLLNGTLSQALPGGSTVVVLRNGVALPGTATLTSQGWTYADSLATSGTYTYTAQVRSSTGLLGAVGPSFGYVLQLGGSPRTASIVGIIDNVGPSTGTFGSSGLTTDDAAPQLTGNLSGALAAGETVRVYRNGGTSPVGTASVAGTTWSFQDAGLVDGPYAYVARVLDSVGGPGSPSATFNINVVGGGVGSGPPTVNVSAVAVTSNTYPTGLRPGGLSRGNPWRTLSASDPLNDTTPDVTITLSAALPASERIEIRLNPASTSADCTITATGAATCNGVVSGGGASWTYRPTVALNGSSRSWQAKVVSSANISGTAIASAARTFNDPLCTTVWAVPSGGVSPTSDHTGRDPTQSCAGCHLEASGRVFAPASEAPYGAPYWTASGSRSGFPSAYPNFSQYWCRKS